MARPMNVVRGPQIVGVRPMAMSKESATGGHQSMEVEI